MRLSYSAISTYQKCPLSYKFLYVDRLPTKPTHHLSFGSSIHSALEFFYSVETPEPCSLDRLLEELDKVWLTEGYENEEHEREYKDKGRAILTRFYEENVPSFRVPVAVEKRFALEMDGFTLSGVIDRIDRLDNGGMEIIDYKTNGKLPPRTKLNTDLQLPIYHMAAEQLYGKAPDRVTLYFLVPNERVSTRKTKTDIRRAQDTIYKVADGIRSEKFDPLKNPLCPWCDFVGLCPIYADDPAMLARAAANGKVSTAKGEITVQPTLAAGAVTTTPDVAKPTVSGLKQAATEIERAVDEYLELVEQLHAMRTRLDELQKKIHDYCEANALTSVSGTRGKLARRARRTTHYNVQKLRELLEPRGLWEKVLDVNGHLLKELVDDPTSQDELRKLIETAKEVEEVSYVLYKKDELAEE